MFELLACRLGRNDEAPNIQIAEKLCENMDKKGIAEIIAGLKSNDKAIANDCIKVLYEIGQRKPVLIADFADDFITALSDKENRIVWGSMKALSCVASIKPEIISSRLSEIITAYKKGSVITVDNSISVFAELCRVNSDCRIEVFPILLNHIKNCRAKDIPQHTERISVCIGLDNKEVFFEVLDARTSDLSKAHRSRILKLKKKICR
ncbi:MAG: hypothetical protein LBQ00_04605 [Syntrophobacterales bacterium]|jgi:hypothetical protein|nr:hypothetical protein [Syntrophobacterales bacterium]